jgi:hypothetical protein
VAFPCPCCGYKTLDEEPPGTHDICPVCFWEDDPAQFEDPTLEGGANSPSLRQAQKNYADFGASDDEMLEYVRAPLPEENHDPGWTPQTL